MELYKEKYKKLIRDYLIGYKPSYVEFLKKRYKGYKYICGFSVGNMGRGVLELADAMGRKIDFYCDNDLQKTGKKDPYGYGIDVISVEELKKYKEETAVLIPTRYYKEIYRQLKELGFPMVDRALAGKLSIENYLSENSIQEAVQRLINTIDILADEESCRLLARLIQEWVTSEYCFDQTDDLYTVPQYFPKDIIRNSGAEVYVDCGAYTGDNIPDFMHYTGGQFQRYYAFELSKSNFEKMKEYVFENWSEHADKFVLENKGVSGETGVIQYGEYDEGSKMEDGGTQIGEVIALDDYFVDRGLVSFIKMDIEGAEMQALRGANKTISKYRPKMAICIYHSPRDLWEIPLHIKTNWPDYDIFIRHHTDLLNETVCYAVRKE